MRQKVAEGSCSSKPTEKRITLFAADEKMKIRATKKIFKKSTTRRKESHVERRRTRVY